MGKRKHWNTCLWGNHCTLVFSSTHQGWIIPGGGGESPGIAFQIVKEPSKVSESYHIYLLKHVFNMNTYLKQISNLKPAKLQWNSRIEWLGWKAPCHVGPDWDAWHIWWYLLGTGWSWLVQIWCGVFDWCGAPQHQHLHHTKSTSARILQHQQDFVEAAIPILCSLDVMGCFFHQNPLNFKCHWNFHQPNIANLQ